MQVQLICPICQARGATEVPDYLLEKSPSGVVAIQVAMKGACEHSFVAYISRMGEVRGYQVPDYLVELDKVIEEGPISPKPQTLREIHQLLGLAALGHILAALSTKKGVFLVGDKITAAAITEFFERILPEYAYADGLQPITEKEYIQTKQELANTVTIDLATRAVLGTPFKAKETEWFCAPITRALEFPNPKDAETYLQQQFLQIWNRLSVLRHLIARAKKRVNNNGD